MKFLFTTSNHLASKLIEWGLKEDVSHFALQSGQLVLDSDFNGFDVNTYSRWAKGRHIKYILTPKTPIGVQKEDKILRAILREFGGDGYDKPGFAYFTWRALQLRLCNRPLPTVNEWGTDDPICTEVARVVAQHLPFYFNTPSHSKLDFGIMSPKALHDNMLSTGLFSQEIHTWPL